MSDKNVRTRYAPSPTGFFHVGGARTALFNYLFAKHHNGKFILRFEDTDIERNVEGGIRSQYDNLIWMNIKPDESMMNPGQYSPYIQSEKLDRYKKLAYLLVEQKKAYYCFCTKEELDERRANALKKGLTPKYDRKCYHLSHEEVQEKLNSKIPYTIRLKMPDNETITWKDLIRGEMNIPTNSLTDPVIFKSNGYPMYNFAVVVDDYDMEITHVLRGEEHLSNTPYQIAIKKALGFDSQEIEYGHLSVIVDETGKKLSKRNLKLKQFIEDYKTMGFLPQAINNFLALLGWSPKELKEIFSLEELIKEFDISRVSKAPAFFDFNKMLWVGNEYFKKLEDQEYLKFIKGFLKINPNDICGNLDDLCLSYKKQISYATQLNDLINEQIINISINNLPSEAKEFITSDNFKKILDLLENKINKLSNLNFELSQNIINEIKTELNIKGKDLFMPIRLIVSYSMHGIELNKLMTFIGKEKILQNIKKYKK